MSRDWLGDIVSDYGKDNKSNRLKGFGEPLSSEVLNGNVLDRTIKNANYLPEWIALQHRIRDQLSKLLITQKDGRPTEEILLQVEAINQQIRKYNTICPPPMQKMKVFPDRIEAHLNQWL
ncbi:DUF1992 domain-containing protein [Bacillus suaedae]|uniref:DUF1992 domain-containing protein n=1 Tax=Halalkalibacter suaedae TaxID=2822140 RepID=A0A941AT90_9BACI|nr:DUF1992 domain-containing protein [Bacillus suaedae]MBP3951179.1 DUF1992 domain-containing protein [Bacillus suaedae]